MLRRCLSVEPVLGGTKPYDQPCKGSQLRADSLAFRPPSGPFRALPSPLHASLIDKGAATPRYYLTAKPFHLSYRNKAAKS